uniref:NADH dehydrogenase subunit 5 n=1 Tax=Heterosiphonia pulchra TaxID=189631 RepID=UPI002E79F2E8|nr:NADH dehydrogenase subunit 5 [Heterosiphonia pulchra]WQF69568.1 NADH dehydrogenase subunit 5 [Heterosiphonia pulchra]
MYLLIIILPLMGSIISGFSGRWIGHYGACVITTTCVSISMIFSLLAFFEISIANTKIFFSLSPWFFSEIVHVYWSFLFDKLTSVMLIVITIISTLVHIYSVSYMSMDPHMPRFMAFLEIFTFFMLMLVTADNIIQLFLGWEGVGLASYLLINFWFTRLAANRSAIKAIILNRIGDFGLLLAILAILATFKSFNYFTIFSLVPFIINDTIYILGMECNILTFIGICLFIGAIGKSAQLGLHTWLPDAMEGPTPVSALIHAATMVTAGIFLVIRFSPLIEYSEITLALLILIGAITTFFAAMAGTFQHDLKKVIAYSTCSQLGYMVFCCGLSNYNLSIFHLTNHAFFKALLFLSAGSVIHALSDEQDMRRMGSIIKYLPTTYSLMLIGTLALIGFPFLTGFYSKDVILEVSSVFRNNNLNINLGVICFWLGNLAVFFTAYYSFRLIFLTFLNNANYNRNQSSLIKESSYIILIPLILLGLSSIFLGYYSKEFFIGLGIDTWNSSIYFYPTHIYFLESEFSNIFIKWIPFWLSLCGILVASIINFQIFSINLIKKTLILNYLLYLINKKWYFDILYNRVIVFPLLYFGYYMSYKNLDRGFIELVGPFGISLIINKLVYLFKNIQTGQLVHYIFFIVLNLSLILNYSIIKNILLLFFYFVIIFFI